MIRVTETEANLDPNKLSKGKLTPIITAINQYTDVYYNKYGFLALQVVVWGEGVTVGAAFEVECSLDGAHFEKVTDITAPAGTLTSAKLAHMQEHSVFPFIRLKCTALTGDGAPYAVVYSLPDKINQ